MDSMMYTKEGEFDVALTGGSPWGFTIRTQSGNGYNRGRVIVAKVVQGGKADSSGNIHVGDEILAVNGLEFDDEKQATEYVRVAKKELILKVKRGQDKRRMNIRLASESPNYFVTALETTHEKKVVNNNTSVAMFTDNDNNKRSSKEFEKDLSYKSGSHIASAIINYQGGQATDLNQSSPRLRSSTDLSEYSSKDQKLQDNTKSWKSYNAPVSPDKVQRVRIRSTNVTSPDHYKCSPGSDKSSSSFDENQKQSASRSSTPGYSPKSAGDAQKPFNSSVMEDLNRTWPSVRISSADVTTKDIHLAAHKSLLSVSAAKLQFEQMNRPSERMIPKEKEKNSKPPLPVPPKPPSRNSSFRSSRLSSSSAVFSDNGTDQSSPERAVSPSSITRHSSFSAASRNVTYEKELNTVRRGSSAEDLDSKPLPPQRYSQSTVLRSFRSNKKPTYLTTKYGQQESLAKTEYHHGRTQSLPSSKLKAFHLASRSWVTSRENEVTKLDDSQRMPRSSSFSRARVMETNSVKTVHRDEPTKTIIKDYATDTKPGVVIQAHRTGEVSSKNINQQNLLLKSKTMPSLKQYKDTSNDTKANASVPVLKENSIMQRLLMESQGQNEPNVRSKAAAIKQEITQRSDSTTLAPRSDNVKKETVPPAQNQRSKNTVSKREENLTEDRVLPFRSVGEIKLKKEIRAANKEIPATEDLNRVSAAKVDSYLNKLIVKLDSSQEKQALVEDDKTLPAERNQALAVERNQTLPAERNQALPVESDQVAFGKRDEGASAQSNQTISVQSDQVLPVESDKVVFVKTDEAVSAQSNQAPPVKSDEIVSVQNNHVLPVKSDEIILAKSDEAVLVRSNEAILVKSDEAVLVENNKVAAVKSGPTLSAEEDVSTEPDLSATQNDENDVEVEALSTENNIVEGTTDSPSSDHCSGNERNADIPLPEIDVELGMPEDVESYPPTIVEDENEEISKAFVPKKTESETSPKTKAFVELKDSQRFQSLSPAELPLKIIHSRENSASSLLEETLESAKTIASIYSVEGPTRSADEDSMSTASEMRRYSLAKRVVKKKTKTEGDTLKKKFNQRSLTPGRIHDLLNDPGSPVDEPDDRLTNSTPFSSSRPRSGIISPKLEVLEEQKELLISSMKKKVELLKEQESEINEEMKQNDELGRRVADDVKNKTSGTEYSKLELFIGELNNIIGLLLSLTQRMHRYEVMLEDIDLAEENGREKRDNLLKRIEKVKQQYDEACTIKEINDKRGETVARFVEEYCSDEGFADFQHFVDMKTQLALTQAEIRDKIKLGEEKLNALTSASIDWNSFDLSSK